MERLLICRHNRLLQHRLQRDYVQAEREVASQDHQDRAGESQQGIPRDHGKVMDRVIV